MENKKKYFDTFSEITHENRTDYEVQYLGLDYIKENFKKEIRKERYDIENQLMGYYSEYTTLSCLTENHRLYKKNTIRELIKQVVIENIIKYNQPQHFPYDGHRICISMDVCKDDVTGDVIRYDYTIIMNTRLEQIRQRNRLKYFISNGYTIKTTLDFLSDVLWNIGCGRKYSVDYLKKELITKDDENVFINFEEVDPEVEKKPEVVYVEIDKKTYGIYKPKIEDVVENGFYELKNELN